MHTEDEYGAQAWKGLDWETMNRLHNEGYIGDPVSYQTYDISFLKIGEETCGKPKLIRCESR